MKNNRPINCNFTGNVAKTGSAMYFYSIYAARTIFNSIFLNNRANAADMQVSENENILTIVFKGNDNLLNAIFSRVNYEVSFTNVTYWGANGINNTGSSEIIPPRTDAEEGLNITIEIYDNEDNLVDNITLLTDESGQVKYDGIKLNNGTYKYKAYHLEDCYYTYSEKTGEFEISSDLGDFNRLQSYINGSNPNSVLTLARNYTFTIGKDENLVDGIVIDKQITIRGNGHAIDAKGIARIFNVTGTNVVFENITFKNGYAADGGAAILMDSGNIGNCNFINNSVTDDHRHGGAVNMASGNVTNCNFAYNRATGVYSYGGAIIFNGEGTVTDCYFANNSASTRGGSIMFTGAGTLRNCNFADNRAANYESYGGSVFFYNDGAVENCNFTNNKATAY